MYNKKQLGQIYSLNAKTMIDDTSIARPKFRFDLWEEQFYNTCILYNLHINMNTYYNYTNKILIDHLINFITTQKFSTRNLPPIFLQRSFARCNTLHQNNTNPPTEQCKISKRKHGPPLGTRQSRNPPVRKSPILRTSRMADVYCGLAVFTATGKIPRPELYCMTRSFKFCGDRKLLRTKYYVMCLYVAMAGICRLSSRRKISGAGSFTSAITMVLVCALRFVVCVCKLFNLWNY